MVDVLVVDHSGEACHSIPDLEVGHRVPNCNNYTAAIAAENSRKFVDRKTIVLDFLVYWICCNCGQVSVQVLVMNYGTSVFLKRTRIQLVQALEYQ